MLMQQSLIDRLPATSVKQVSLDLDWHEIAEYCDELPSSHVAAEKYSVCDIHVGIDR